jgi:transcription antitermination factor NusG
MITMVQDTPQINSIVSMLIEEYETIFLVSKMTCLQTHSDEQNKEMQEVVATALYDYDAQDETEISFKAGDTVKVLSQVFVNNHYSVIK